MENEKTIIIDTGFYKKTVNKNQFVERWVDHVQELALIVDYNNLEQVAIYKKFEMIFKDFAKEQFERSYTHQINFEDTK